MIEDKDLDELLGDVWMAGHDYAIQGEGLEVLREANGKDRETMTKAKQSLQSHLKRAELRGKRNEILDILKFVGFDSSTDSLLDLSNRLEEVETELEQLSKEKV